MEVRWMTMMTWNLSKTGRTMQAYRELMARRMTTTERCWRKMEYARNEGMGTPPGNWLLIKHCPEQTQAGGDNCLCRHWAGCLQVCITSTCVGPLLPLRSIAWKCSQTVGMILSCCFSWKHFLIYCVLHPLVFPIPSQAGDFIFFFLNPWAAEGCLNWSLDLLNWLLIQRNLSS